MNRFLALVFLGIVFVADFLLAKTSDLEKKTSQKQKKYNLSVCAIFKNEAKYLREWIEYHQLAGVDHFYLYNNNSVDRFNEVLKPYITQGMVTLIHWPDYLNHLKEEDAFLWALGTQIPAYENAAKVRALNETKWLAFLDVGEFLIPTRTSTLKEILEQYEEYPGITFLSDHYDASRLYALPGRNFLIETVELTFQPEENNMKKIEKTIFKPEQTEYFLWPPYQCIFKGNQVAALVDRSDIRINRYVNRFKGFLYFGKIKDQLHVDNRLMSHNQIRELLQLGYEIEDQERIIFRFLPEMQKRLGFNDSSGK